VSTEARRPPAGARGDNISRNVAFAYVGRLSSAAFTAALTVFLTRELGPAGFGIFALAMSVTGLIRRPAGGGSTEAAARYIAERHGDVDAIVGVLGMALRFRLLTAAAFSVGLFAFADPIAELYDTPALVSPLRWMAVAFFGQSILQFALTVFVSLRRASGAFVMTFSEAAMEFTASVVLVLIIGGATSAALGRAVGYAFGALLGLLLLTRLLGRSPLFRTGPSPVPRREFVGYAGAMLIVIVSSAVFASVDVLLLGAFLTPAAVGVYAAPLRLMAFLAYPALAVAQGVSPRLARGRAEAPNVAALARSLKYVVIFHAALVPLLLVWAEPIVRLALGSEFLPSAEVLRALAPFAFLTGFGTLLVQPLNYAGEGRSRIPTAVASVLLAIGIDVVLIPEIGILGAAYGTNIGYAVYIGGHAWLMHSRLGLSLLPLADTTVRAFIAAGGMAAVLALAGTSELSAFEWIWGSLSGAAVFISLLLITRAISSGDIRFLASLPRRMFRKA
jgi:O-antigen/teichoic acid export membrane protein